MISVKSLIPLLFTVILVSANRVLLRDVTSLTLRRAEYTTGRRAPPVPQLQCIGGTAQGKFVPKTVQCYNRGFDGLDVQWECQAELPHDYQFGRISVTCEGYDYANDPYILAGSCGLKYELDYSSGGAKRSTHYGSSREYETNYTYIFYFIVIAFVLYLLYTTMTSTREGGEGDRFRGSDYPDGGPGGGGNNDGPPYPPGWRPQPPPSYDETFKNTGSAGSRGTGSSGPGFFSGLGLGALGGYFLGNNRWGSGWNSGYGSAYRRRGPTQYERDTGFYSDSYDRPGPSHEYYSSSPGPSSSSTRTSSGFGGTERR